MELLYWRYPWDSLISEVHTYMYYKYAKDRATQVPSLDNWVVAIKGIKYSSKTEEILRRCLACMYTGVRHSKLNSVVVDNGTLIVSQGHR